MSIRAAINLAVTLELLSSDQDDYNNYERVLGPDIAGGAQGFGLRVDKIDVFLQRVAMRLKDDDPVLNFDWSSVDRNRCLTANREVLIGLIAGKTKPVDSGRPKGGT